MSSVNPYGIRPARLTANGQAFTGRGLVKALCWAKQTGATGTFKFYNKVGAPGGGDTPVCEIDVVGTGTSTFYVPEPGVLITEGLYVEVPANTSVNFFYEVV